MCGSQVVVTSYNLGLSGLIEQTNVAPLNPSGFFLKKKKRGLATKWLRLLVGDPMPSIYFSRLCVAIKLFCGC